MKYIAPWITNLSGDVRADGPGAVIATLKSIPNKVYVDFVSGSDSNTGTIVSPWKTLQHAYNSITPSINFPYVIYLSGGNNSTDTSPITGKADVSIVADYSIQVPAITINFLAFNSNGCTFVNLNFTGPLTSIRTDGLTSGCTFINCQFFSGPIVKNTGGGTCSVSGYNSQFLNSEFQLFNGGFGIFTDCTFFGTTTFDDPGSSGFSYIEFLGGYSSGTMSFTGLYNPVYFTGFVHDVAFGAAVSFSAGIAGPSPLEIDANGLPPTFTGTPGAITYLSTSKYIDFTKGALLGSTSVPTAANVLLQVKDGHQKSTQTTAPTTTTDTNAGTGASSSVSNATDSAGILNLTSGSGAFSAGVQVTVNFNKAYNVAPIISLTPANASAANDVASHDIYISSTVNGFSVNFGIAQNNASTSYIWHYHVIETQ